MTVVIATVVIVTVVIVTVVIVTVVIVTVVIGTVVIVKVLIGTVVEELSLYTLWDEHTVDFTCVSETNGVTSVSKLDHFFLSRNLRDLVEDAGVIHHPENKSDHCPVYVVMKTLEIH